jgi:redox-sensitive bicupin YhaK (pirin superfamily)
MSVGLERAFLKQHNPPKWHVQVRTKDPHNNIAIYSENTQCVRALVFPDKEDTYRVAFYGPIIPSDRDKIEEALKDTELNVSIMNTPFINPSGF